MALLNRLKEYRARLGINQTELGKLAGVSRQTISLIERGDYSPSVTLALKLAKICQVKVEDIFEYEEDESWKTKKIGTYKKMGLILLAGAAGGGLVGALLGAGMELYGSGIASGAGNVLSALQRVMLPLMIAIGAAGILAGESCIWKMKNIGEEIAEQRMRCATVWNMNTRRRGRSG